MTANDRHGARGSARARRILAELAAEWRRTRLEVGWTQEQLGRRLGMSGDKVWQMEHEKLPSLSIADACELSALLGLDFVCRLYPSGVPIRDAAQAARLMKVLRYVTAPLRYRTDAPLSAREGVPERRAWDALVMGSGERTAIELESRLTDVQATTRRHNEKRRDDPVDHFLLVVASTRHNRQVMAQFGPLMADLPRLRTASVLRDLARGRHPPTGWMLL